MRTKFSVFAEDNHGGTGVNIISEPGLFNHIEMTIQEREILVQFVSNALDVIVQLRRHKENERNKAAAAERQRSETGDDVSEVGLSPQGGNKVGLC